MHSSLMIPARFCGPPSSGNGGYVAGALAERVSGADGGAVEVSLRQPPPLNVEMVLETEDGDEGERTVASFGGARIAEAHSVATEIEPVEPVSLEVAVAAAATYPGLSFHPFPTCFACGVDRVKGDGLRIFPGQVAAAGDGSTRVAAPWLPDVSLSTGVAFEDDQTPRANLAATWAALDCVGGWAGDLTERLMVLGRMVAVVDTLPRIDEQHVVVGEKVSESGRKTYTASTLYDADDRIVARAQHVWISVDTSQFT